LVQLTRKLKITTPGETPGKKGRSLEVRGKEKRVCRVKKSQVLGGKKHGGIIIGPTVFPQGGGGGSL